MIARNCKLPFTLHCCTEDSTDIRDEVNIVPLPMEYGLETFWWKVWITSNEFPIKDKCIYFDLDMVIQNDMSRLIESECFDKILIIKAQWKLNGILTKGYKLTKTNSSIMIWDNTKRIDNMFDIMISNAEYYMLKYHGNDDYMEAEFSSVYDTLPHEWFYTRIWGYDDSDLNQYDSASDKYTDDNGIDIHLYRMPDRMICIFNGIVGIQDISDFDIIVYRGFEHYWSD